MQGGGVEKQKTDKEPSGTVPDNTTFTLFLQISPRRQGGNPRADEFTRGKEAISQTESRSREIDIISIHEVQSRESTSIHDRVRIMIQT